MKTYLLLVLRGLEHIAELEIYEKLKVQSLQRRSIGEEQCGKGINFMQGEAGVGRLLLKTTSKPQQVMELQSVQAVLAYLCESDDIDTETSHGIQQIGEEMEQADWEGAFQVWRSHFEHPITFQPSFRGSCIRDGKHAYKSVDIAGEIGAVIVDKFGWKVRLDTFDLEIVALVFYNTMIAGISLLDPAKSQFRSRLANEYRAFLSDSTYISTLRPSTTYIMYRLAECQDGDIIADTMCGVGSIPICCAAFTNNNVFALGGELNTDPVAKAGENVQSGKYSVGVCQWDSTRLPVRSNSIDKVLIDMPFGVRCGNHKMNNKMYPQIIKELSRVLRHGGRAVLLVLSKKLFMNSIRFSKTMRLLQSHQVNIGGLASFIYVVEKNSVIENEKSS